MGAGGERAVGQVARGAARRSRPHPGSIERSPSGATSTTHVPVGSAGSTATARVDAVAGEPRHGAAARVVVAGARRRASPRAPATASHAATFAPAPPGRGARRAPACRCRPRAAPPSARRRRPSGRRRRRPAAARGRSRAGRRDAAICPPAPRCAARGATFASRLAPPVSRWKRSSRNGVTSRAARPRRPRPPRGSRAARGRAAPGRAARRPGSGLATTMRAVAEPERRRARASPPRPPRASRRASDGCPESLR